MTLTDSLTPSDFTPPSDPAELQAWLDDEVAAMAALMEAEMARLIAESVTAYLDSVTAAGDPALLDPLASQWSPWVAKEIGPNIARIHLEGALTAVISSKTNPPSAFLKDLWTPVVNDEAVAYAKQATNRIVGAGNDVWWKVRSKVTGAVRDGVPTEQLKGQIEDITGYSEFRADTIARTEVMGAYNAGDHEGARALGEYGPVEQSWLAALDARTRESHAEANGQCVPFGDSFNVGGTMMPYPGVGPPEEVVNCRCVVLHLYPGDTRPDGTKVEGAEVNTGRLDTPELPPEPPPPKPPPKPPKVTTHKANVGVNQVQSRIKPNQVTTIGNVSGHNSLAPMKDAVAYKHRGTAVIVQPDASTMRWLKTTEGSYDEVLTGLRQRVPDLKRMEDAIDELHDTMPLGLADELPRVVLSPERNPMDSYWARAYKRPNFRSAATGGDDGVQFYEFVGSNASSSLRHEVGHVLERVDGKTKTKVSDSSAWKSAMESDAARVNELLNTRRGGRMDWNVDVIADGHNLTAADSSGITTYGQASKAEDLAESMRLYLLDRKVGALTQDGLRFHDIFPARAKQIDDMLMRIAKRKGTA